MGERLTNKEKALLCSLVTKYKTILECKKTDAGTNFKKVKCWQQMEEEFNCHAYVTKRSWKQLRKAWDNMKVRRRRLLALQARKQMGTAGEPSPSTPRVDPISELDIVYPDGLYLESMSDNGQLGGQPCSPTDVDLLTDDVEIPVAKPNTQSVGEADGLNSVQEGDQRLVDPSFTVLNVETVGSNSHGSSVPSLRPAVQDSETTPKSRASSLNATPKAPLTRGEALLRELEARMDRIKAATERDEIIHQFELQSTREKMIFEREKRKKQLEEEDILRQIRIQRERERLEHQRRMNELEYQRMLGEHKK